MIGGTTVNDQLQKVSQKEILQLKIILGFLN